MIGAVRDEKWDFTGVLDGTNDIVWGIRGHQVRPSRILRRKQQFILTGAMEIPGGPVANH